MNRDRPVAIAVLIAAAWGLFAVGGYLVLVRVNPTTTPMTGGLWIIMVIAAVVALAVALLGWWRSIGFTPLAEWREQRWLILPAALTLLPLVTGVRVPDTSLWLLIGGYALTGFAEEAVYRGIVLRLLGNGPRVTAVAISAVLFGLAHLANAVIRGNPGVALAQAVGAACFGFGYGAVRLRTNTLVPLIFTHMLTDLFLQVGKLPLIPVAVAQDVVLLLYGLWLLRPGQRA
jgi:membrane protease YdiL (CAAX protease family)